MVIDIGMHLGLPIPDDAEGSLAAHRGQQWTPELARAFLGENSGADLAFLDSELVRYLGIPGQAISYKLGERAWLEGREAARQARGADVRPQGLAHGRALTGFARPRRPRRRARAAVVAGGGECEPRDRRAPRDREHGPRRAEPRPGPGNANDTRPT